MPIVTNWLWLAAAVGCFTSPTFDGPVGKRTEQFVDPGINDTEASPVVQLWKTRGRYDLPLTTLPDGFTPVSTFPLEMTQGSTITEGFAVWTTPSPLEGTRFGPLGAPKGFEMYANGEPLPYAPPLRGKGYSVRNGKLMVSWPEGEPVPEVTLRFASVEQTLRRRDFGTDPEQDPLAFVQTEVTLYRHTRQGLLLPAPATVDWDVAIPEGGRFEGWPSLAPVALRNLKSDGAYVVLSVVKDGTPTALDRRFVKRGQTWSRWIVDLSSYAGQTITLRLSSEVYGTRDFDHAFVGSPAVWGQAAGPVRRVIVIGLDTTRPDHFGFFGYDKPTTPQLDKVLGQSAVFTQAWTPAPRTRPSFRSATTGRHPLKAVGATNLGKVLSDQGFVTGGIVANVHLQPRFGFHRGFDEWQFDGEAKVDEQVDRALEFIARYPDRDVFLFLHIMDPHLAYRAPAAIERLFVTDPDPTMPSGFNRWAVYRWLRHGEVTERRKKHLIGMYDAELRFTDDHLGRLFSQIDRFNQPTLTVMHNDHGEEFFEHGGFEHNHALYDEVTRGLLMFRSNAGQTRPQRIDTPATLMDIAPTVYDFLGLEPQAWPELDGRSLKPLLLPEDPPAPWADRPLGVAHLRYGLEQWGVVHQGHKYILTTATGREELYDLTADPGEQNDLAKTTGLEAWRQATSIAHEAPLGRGWRIDVSLTSDRKRSPFTFVLPRPAVTALIVDPEAEVRNPANQAWGQRPTRTTADIGTVALSEDKTTLTYLPATADRVRGQIVVLFGRDVDPSKVTMKEDGKPLTVITGRKKAVWRTRRDSLTVAKSTVVAPPPSEVDRIRALEGDAQDMGSDAALLKELGYVE